MVALLPYKCEKIFFPSARYPKKLKFSVKLVTNADDYPRMTCYCDTIERRERRERKRFSPYNPFSIKREIERVREILLAIFDSREIKTISHKEY